MALNARISWASRREDNSKVDLIATLAHPWRDKKIEVIFVQVKFGPRYAGLQPPGTRRTLEISKQEFRSFLNTNHHSLICWVNPNDNEVYWFLIRLNSTFYRTHYGPTHVVTPATKYD